MPRRRTPHESASVLPGRPPALPGERLPAARCEFIGGDLFQAVPGGADVYLLKSVLHDWDDTRAQQILHTCHRAMAGAARLLLIERLLPERLQASDAHRALARSDLTMRVAHGARERSEKEFVALLASAGFRTHRIVPTTSALTIIEALP